MQGKFTYSKRAVREVQKIYIDTAREWGIAQADKYDSGLEHSLQLLADNPNLGRTCDYIRKGYQRHEYGRHNIFTARAKPIFLLFVLFMPQWM